MQFLVRLDSFIQLLLPNVAPGTHSVADDFNIEVGHIAKGRSEHEMVQCSKQIKLSSETLDGICVFAGLAIYTVVLQERRMYDY